MKLFILYIFSFLTMNQATAQVLPQLVKAFKTSDVPAISSHLDNSVEVTLNGKNTTYSKAQAARFVSDFFNANKVSDFKVLHQSESGGTAYCIGNLQTSTGNYRITIFAKEKGGKSLIQEMKFEK